jgi:hypothetical protein
MATTTGFVAASRSESLAGKVAMEHHCHAFGCKRSVPPKLLMCAGHWRRVPREIQTQVWRHYRPGQEIDKQPTPEYLLVQRAAVWAVFVGEGGCQWPDVPEIGSAEFMVGPAILKLTPQERLF